MRYSEDIFTRVGIVWDIGMIHLLEWIWYEILG